MTAKAQPAAGGKPSWMRADRTQLLAKEPRRALAVFRALRLAGAGTASRQLLGYCGRSAHDGGELAISNTDCDALAGKLRGAGYPLSDAGIVRFKMERGFSQVVRISPDVASAYARFAAGVDVRLNCHPATLETLDEEAKNALELLLLMGRDPATLIAVRRRLGVRDSDHAPPGVILVGRVSAERLVRWAHCLGWRLDGTGLERLARARYGEHAGLSQELATFVADCVLCRGEPQHDYTRIRRDGYTLNRRTAAMLRVAESRLPGDARFRVTNGSYETGGGKGAHPHMGGGVVDVDLGRVSPALVERAVAALRYAGFAAWYRLRGEHPHIHAVAIGDREMAAAAAWQVKAYLGGRDGRSRSEPDPHARAGTRPPAWVVKYRVGQC